MTLLLSVKGGSKAWKGYKKAEHQLEGRRKNRKADKRENGIYWKDQKDDMDGVTIPTPWQGPA